jgi:CRISPR-associated protein Csd1
MQAFAQNPSKIWPTIWNALLPYMAQLKGGAKYYLSLFDQIGALFQENDFTASKPLGGAYLLGYYCQRKAIDEHWSAVKKKIEEVATHEPE